MLTKFQHSQIIADHAMFPLKNGNAKLLHIKALCAIFKYMINIQVCYFSPGYLSAEIWTGSRFKGSESLILWVVP